jgi:hypothetical protein
MTIELLQDVSRRVIAAWASFDAAETALRRRYLAGEPRAVDREAFEGALAEAGRQRDSEIAAVQQEANRSVASHDADSKRRLGRDLGKPGDAAVESAWTGRVKPRLDGGFPLEEILEAPGLTRPDIEALRANYPAYVDAKVGPSASRDATIRDSIAAAERLVDGAELGLLDGDVRAATVEARQRDGAERAMQRARSYDKERRESKVPMPLDAKTELGLAFGIATDLGVPAHEPGRRPWESIIEEIEPLAHAQAERNSLPQELRDALDGNARDVGFGRADPSLRPSAPDGTGADPQE